jgi:LCP family protein required for cell wall assembly
MTAAPQPLRRARTWPQRLLIALGVVAVLGCATAGAAAAYFGLRFSQIDRVEGIELEVAAKGEPQNYLIVGTDSREGLDPKDPDAAGFVGGGERGCNCTDTIMVVRVDPEETTASVLSLPRDLWVPVQPSGQKARINSAYQHGEQALIDTIEQNFGIAIHHYLEIDFVGFEKLVDAVGGIPLWFDTPVRDSHTGLSVSKTGCVVLNGRDARRFARSRYLQYKGKDGRWHQDPTADFGRITRQQIFVRRAIDKAVAQGLGNPVTLNRLVSAGVQNLKLDKALGAGDLLSLGRRFKSFDSKELVTYSIPSTSYTTSAGAAVQLPNLREAEPILNIFRGLPPGSISPQAIDLTVLNGSEVQGQAADAAGALHQIGFVVTDVDDYPSPVGRTTVLYGSGGYDAGRTVARHVTGGAALVESRNVGAGEVVLVIGKDFTTVHDQLAPEGSPDDVASTSTTTVSQPDGEGDGGPATTAPTTTTTVQGYATGEPPPGVTCDG